MTTRILPAIMSGGSGTRLWPVSHAEQPKQFHALLSGEPLIDQTLRRVVGSGDNFEFGAPLLLGSERHEDLLAAALQRVELTPSAIVLEPCGRNTAAAAAIAAAVAQEADPDALVLLLPSDHLIGDEAAFRHAISIAAPLAQEHIITFGIAPNRAATEYGYIRLGEALTDGAHKIQSFKEKPIKSVAESYFAEGGYCWNAGMFLFKPSVLLREFARAESIRDMALAALQGAQRRGPSIYFDLAAFERIPSAPLDIAVMETTTCGAVVSCDLGWADIGSWDEVFRLADKDANGNAIHGDVRTLDASGNLLRSTGPKLIVSGIEDLIVIATDDAVIVLPRSRAQDVKKLSELAKDLES